MVPNVYAHGSQEESMPFHKKGTEVKVLNESCLNYYLIHTTLLSGLEFRDSGKRTRYNGKVCQLLLTSRRILNCFMCGAGHCTIVDGEVASYGQKFVFYTKKPSQIVAFNALYAPKDAYLQISEQVNCPAQRYLIEMIYKAKKLNVKLWFSVCLHTRIVQQVLAEVNYQIYDQSRAPDTEMGDEWKFYGVPLAKPKNSNTINIADQLWKNKVFHHVVSELWFSRKPRNLAIADAYLAELFDTQFATASLHSIKFLTFYHYHPLPPQVQDKEFYCVLRMYDMLDDAIFDIYRTILSDFERVCVKKLIFKAKLYIDAIGYDKMRPIFQKLCKALNKMKQVVAGYMFVEFTGDV
ncbi:unnamed protein product [Bursaphelenchus okinawaensis]|uniref:Uncharacterized protein n=1 Tax=Bursaphelenchus okinawaensis TaxID=465554 RepID=A0A811L768_9BILA|nr:unnamed protein product [Bursaphelenchus okinawaensis]CAG9118190.1 unnamed protein product [Bursaphelenchus okinawaensis]